MRLDLVKSLVCKDCQIIVYDIAAGCKTMECRQKAKEYGITAVPSIVVDGRLLECCTGRAITSEVLKATGIGVPL